MQAYVGLLSTCLTLVPHTLWNAKTTHVYGLISTISPRLQFYKICILHIGIHYMVYQTGAIPPPPKPSPVYVSETTLAILSCICRPIRIGVLVHPFISNAISHPHDSGVQCREPAVRRVFDSLSLGR
ncbi:uncharacterized protein K460DRAFT_142479 [Cucurbitaria berberidis CBS 394.84]|uniref:Uncharacterized protein n=1 Tax=Cucurbitaria berberidis CBS 394.84 TaxID=1168544 RepID=A0A9P4GDA5_9PLEO|nr:uncharacterized protein K460DRAFT_142479 [Cucurbitaria berberidis CBS 394.84]KAF1843282.1 hypothetical protein K460DRAFT_142479 [Cucurbitaria berberidis CBS 394.84]